RRCGANCDPCPKRSRWSRTAAVPTACTPTMPSANCVSGASAPAAWRTGSRNGREPAYQWHPVRRRDMADVLVDANALREQVKEKYREVALDPGATFHFHTGRTQAARLGYERSA